MAYGYFDDARGEYVITELRTPVKWINYIGSLDFGGFVDHTGGALICKGDPATNRLTRYLGGLPASEFKGETLYVRLKTPGGYRLFSPFYVPCLAPYERFECRVGLGYSRWTMEALGLRVGVTVFVPEGQAVEVRQIQVTATGDQPVEVDLVPVVEYSHFDALKQLTNADWVPQTMVSRAHPEPGGRVVLEQYAFMRRETAVNFFTASLPAASWETDRRLFLGANEYGAWADPLSLQAEQLPCSQATRGDNIAALLLPLGRLQPGETRQAVTLLGQAPSLEAARPAIDRYRQAAAVEAALDELAAAWGKRLAAVQVSTPDPLLDSMLNIHNPRQCFITLNWSRDLSLYQPGYGQRGMGFRDSAQDVMGALTVDPGRCRSVLRLLLQAQKRDGSAMHQFNPLTLEASTGDSAERLDRPHFYGDDALWIVLAVTAYLKETGDFDFLAERLPFNDKDRAGRPLEAATVLEHLYRALEFTRTHTGAHGLPLLGFADWNDTVNLASGAESAFVACLYGQALGELAGLEAFLGHKEAAAKLGEQHAAMRQAFEACAWDGSWYVSYFDAGGAPLGSHTNAAGQIYAYGQAWPVLCGFAAPERAAAALQAVAERLATEHGIKLSAPGFDGFDPDKGGITTYPPGAKENGGIFLHVNPWVIRAEALLGNGERAYSYYARINPAAQNERIESYECEPYAYPQNVLGDEHLLFGLARNSWLSGTASWMEQVGVQTLLGVQPDYDALVIDPCIPPSWAGFRVRRRFRGVTYEIDVRSPHGACRGVSRLVVDGQPLPGSRVPLFPGGVHQVEVILGE